MNKRDFHGKIRVALTAMVLCALCCESRAVPTPLPGELTSGSYRFAFDLLEQLAGEQPGANIFISPYSASTALQMACSGAAGSTRAQMQYVLGTASMPPRALYEAIKINDEYINARNTNVVLNAANAIWYRSGFPLKMPFIRGNEEYFGATVRGLDFSELSAVDTINAWASAETQGKISQIVTYPMDASIQILLANAVYFHGNWEYQFDTNLTSDQLFMLQGGGQESIPMMQQTGTFDYSETSDYQAVRLPYQGSNIAMYVFLPNANSSVDDLLAAMSGPWWQKTINGDFSPQNGTLVLPKFNLNFSATLNDSLESLGMVDAFTQNADFSILSNDPIMISQVKQQAVIEVDEQGTTAAAITTIVGVTSVAVGQSFQMTVNRPFVFMIQDRQAQTILFMGAVFNP